MKRLGSDSRGGRWGGRLTTVVVDELEPEEVAEELLVGLRLQGPIPRNPYRSLFAGGGWFDPDLFMGAINGGGGGGGGAIAAEPPAGT